MSFSDMVQVQPSNQQGSMDILSPEYNLMASKLDDADRVLGKKADVYPTDYPTDFDQWLSDIIDAVPLA